MSFGGARGVFRQTRFPCTFNLCGLRWSSKQAGLEPAARQSERACGSSSKALARVLRISRPVPRRPPSPSASVRRSERQGRPSRPMPRQSSGTSRIPWRPRLPRRERTPPCSSSDGRERPRHRPGSASTDQMPRRRPPRHSGRSSVRRRLASASTPAPARAPRPPAARDRDRRAGSNPERPAITPRAAASQ